MTRQAIPIEKFTIRPKVLWADQWLLLTAGDFRLNEYNAMTVGWGSAGFMWGIPFVQVVIRPHRYTFGFMERFDTFTLSAFPETWRPALQLLGSRSGRSGNKIAEAGLTPIPSTKIAAPGYEEAELVMECRKIYWDDMERARFLDPRIEKNYPQRDYHRIYYGELVAITTDPTYTAG
jgi:flavin reductase (DIM6/NTAB) family NADH-FMN oxidoreductase RutF